ncbi:MAG: Fic family protein [Gemmiger sp.]|nr:Fic family protein [Gemmiger sp.]
MTATQFAEMLSDKQYLDLERMAHKYGRAAVSELLAVLQESMLRPLPLADFGGKLLLYFPQSVQLSLRGARALLTPTGLQAAYGQQAMVEEIHASLSIENIHSERNSIRNILAGRAPQSEDENRIYGLKRGLDFIADTAHTITEENLHTLYQLAIGDFLPEDDRLKTGQLYRDGAVFILGGKQPREGLSTAKLPAAMKALVAFAGADSEMNDLHKAAALHFYLAYLHPYFDGNGRTARLLHLWYLVQNGYPAALFTSVSQKIEQSRSGYYRAFDLTEQNANLSGRLDITPFLAYFSQQVYDKLEPTAAQGKADMQTYRNALAAGKITEKERQLWEFVLTAYGTEEFTTKRLEKDFGAAAYATIRTFVQKFEGLGLLGAQAYGNRVKYWVK